MASRAITFDFHNTLIHCDPWFELEVRTLPSAFLTWLWREGSALPDNSLAVAANVSYRRLRRSIIAHGHELTAERSLATVFASLDIRVDDETIAQGVHALMWEALIHATPVPGAVTTVEQLSERGVALGVVSSAVYHPFLEWSLDRLGIAGRFSVIVTSASCGYYKSRPEIYWSALSLLASNPGDCLHVGDSARFDVGGAHRAGMRTAWLTGDEETLPPQTRPGCVLTTLEGAAPGLYDQLMTSTP